MLLLLIASMDIVSIVQDFPYPPLFRGGVWRQKIWARGQLVA